MLVGPKMSLIRQLGGVWDGLRFWFSGWGVRSWCEVGLIGGARRDEKRVEVRWVWGEGGGPPSF